MNILIVDDEEHIREGLARTIDWSKYAIDKVFTAENAWQALDVVKNYKMDLIITDIRMPGISGIDLIRKTIPLDNNIKYIIISGYAEFEYAKAALKLQVIDYLMKPVNISELIHLVCKVLGVSAEVPKGHFPKHYGRLEDQVQDYSELYSPLVKKCIAYFDEHFYDDITLNKLSEIMERNPSYISHVFRKETDKTLTEYLNSLRINRAIQLINSSNLFLYEIASMVGFDDYRYFINVFRKITGKTPTDYSRN